MSRIQRPVVLGEDRRVHVANISTAEDTPPLGYRIVADTPCGLSNLESHGPVRRAAEDPTCPVCQRRRSA